MHVATRKLAAACLALAAIMPFASQADLVRRTITEGPLVLEVTTDTATGLDWLDVRLTVNQTFDQVRTGPYYQLGFRHATRGELQTLFANAGTPDDNFDISTTHPSETAALVDLLGATRTSWNSRHSTGFSGTDFFGVDITLATHPIGTTFSALLGKVDYMDLRSVGSYLLGEAHFSGGHPFSDQPSPDYGSFLVRPSGQVSSCRTVGHSPNLKCHDQGRGQYK
jgi:hypothetical protein